MALNASLSGRISGKTTLRYTFALSAIMAALLLRLALNPLIGDYTPYITLFPAVAFCAWYCGVGPSALGVVLGLLGTQFWFTSPRLPLHTIGRAQWVGILAFFLASAVVIFMGETRRRHEQILSVAQMELEEAVKERTVELDRTNQSLRELSARLLQLQDDERRRIARELHDSVGQMLAALGMNLATVGSEIERLTQTAGRIHDSAALVQELSKEVRTISHLLHPPLLDEAGLASALRWYIDGFVRRSNIEVDLQFADHFGRLSRDSETAVFRTVQECLTNIHRHAESPTAKIRIAASDRDVEIEVEDRGKGIPPEKQLQLASTGTPGVGIRGMRERLRQLGGSLDVHSSNKGTRIVARLPIATPSPATNAAA